MVSGSAGSGLDEKSGDSDEDATAFDISLPPVVDYPRSRLALVYLSLVFLESFNDPREASRDGDDDCMFVQHRGASGFFLQGQDDARKKALHWQHHCKIVAIETCNRTRAGPRRRRRQTDAISVGPGRFPSFRHGLRLPLHLRRIRSLPRIRPLSAPSAERQILRSPSPALVRAPRRVEPDGVNAAAGPEILQVNVKNSMASAAPTMQGRCFERVAGSRSSHRTTPLSSMAVVGLQRFFPLCSRHLACPRST